jgi:hypothetical protein
LKSNNFNERKFDINETVMHVYSNARGIIKSHRFVQGKNQYYVVYDKYNPDWEYEFSLKKI